MTERSNQGVTDLTDDHKDDGVIVFRKLLEAGAKINKKDVYELSPLHHASLRSNSQNFINN